MSGKSMGILCPIHGFGILFPFWGIHRENPIKTLKEPAFFTEWEQLKVSCVCLCMYLLPCCYIVQQLFWTEDENILCVTRKLKSKIVMVLLLLLLQTDLSQAIRCSLKEAMKEKKGVLPCLEFQQFMQCIIPKCPIAKVHVMYSYVLNGHIFPFISKCCNMSLWHAHCILQFQKMSIPLPRTSTIIVVSYFLLLFILFYFIIIYFVFFRHVLHCWDVSYEYGRRGERGSEHQTVVTEHSVQEF